MTGFEVREGRRLGSPLRLTVATPVTAGTPVDPERVDVAWMAACAAFDEVDVAMSRFRDDSELTLLNRRVARRDAFEAATAPVHVPSRLLAGALALADRARRTTGGRFDARVVADLERLGATGVPQGTMAARQRPPTAAPSPAPLVTRDGRGPLSLRFPADLGGLGKGLALRLARRRVETILEVEPFLLDAGGDLTSSGEPAGERLGAGGGWSIGIEDPSGAGEPMATLLLEPGQSIATSSVRIGRWSAPDGQPVHHLIDPLTGRPGGAGLRAVTVAWPDPAWAEVWTKALFLEGARGIAMAARRRGLAAWWVDDAGELSMTPAARMQTTWVRSEATSAA